MEEELTALLTQHPQAFSKEQVAYMVENMGHTNPTIRDETIYLLCCKGFDERIFSREQVKHMVQRMISSDNLFLNISEGESDSSFTRSFTALFYALVMYYDHQPFYERVLTSEQRTYLFSSSLSYLEKERDERGFVEGKGWLHGIAHGADFVTQAIGHSAFSKEDTPKILKVVGTVISRERQPFKDDEEGRLASILVALLETEKITETSLVEWFTKIQDQLARQMDNLQTYYMKQAVRRMSIELYFQGRKLTLLSAELETSLISWID